MCPTAPVVDDKYCIKPTPGNVFNYSSTDPFQTFTLDAEHEASTTTYRITESTGPELFVSESSSKTFISAWGGSVSDYGNSVIQMNDGGYIFTGYSAGYGAGSNDIVIAEFNPDGVPGWGMTLGGIGSDMGYEIINTSDGGFAITGTTASYGAGLSDMFLAKFASDKSLTWISTWGGAAGDNGRSLVQTDDGGYAVVGYTASFGAGGNDIFLAKYQSDGTLSWSKTYGGALSDIGSVIKKTSDGEFILAGYTQSFGAGGSDIFIAKLTSDGTFAWANTWGGTLSDIGNGLVLAGDGGYVISGSTSNYGAGSSDFLIAKFTSDGNFLWNKIWGGAGVDTSNSLIRVNDGFVAAGLTQSFGQGSDDTAIVKYDSDGNLLWFKIWGGTALDAISNIINTNDGGFAAAGRTASFGTGLNDIFLAKYKSDGLIDNCSSPMCQSPAVTLSSPSAAITPQTFTVNTITASFSSPVPSYLPANTTSGPVIVPANI